MSLSRKAVRPLMLGGLLLYALLTALAGWGTPFGLWRAAYLMLLLEFLPVLAVAQLPLVEEESLPRIPVYLSSGALILGIGAVGLILGWRGLGLRVMGLGEVPARAFLLWTVGLLAAALLLLWGFLVIRRLIGAKERDLLAQLLPRTGREKVVFAFLSLAAGFGEEIAYRGFLIPALTRMVGWEWRAALVSSALFGILHSYQGWLGIVRTSALGFLLAASFLLSGTLWPAIFAHAILDLLAGLVLGETLLKE